MPYTPRFRPRYRPILRRLFQSRWDALIERRRQQRHAYTSEELEKIKPDLIERWRQRHEKWAEEAKVHEEVMKLKPRVIPTGFVPRFRPRYRSMYIPRYRSVYITRARPKPKYICSECGSLFLWLNDFLAHVKDNHPGKQPLKTPKIWWGVVDG